MQKVNYENGNRSFESSNDLYTIYICHDNLLLSVSRGNEGKQCGDNAFLVHIHCLEFYLTS